ncbi:hypothetical protein O181_014075 [Austropuccinia psidii MF-1]|uniref:Uncharacterized protein n=1 Tax=Austropuccinia psidii MF-1 TaxID=1389203 RepID=A0A9Q3C171_9BASI|nr:hypothetical protein [Austropuccinia psidii MF-1]
MILDLGKGSINITHHVKFIPTIFPSNESGKDCTENTQLTLAQLVPKSKESITLEIGLIKSSPTPPEAELEMEAPPIDNSPTNTNLPT